MLPPVKLGGVIIQLTEEYLSLVHLLKVNQWKVLLTNNVIKAHCTLQAQAVLFSDISPFYRFSFCNYPLLCNPIPFFLAWSLKSVSYYLIVARQQIHIHQQHVQYPSLKIILKNQSTFNSTQKNCCIILSWRVTLTVHLELSS